MACIEEIAKDAKFNKIEDQLLVLIRRQVETQLKLEEKFQDICEEVSNFVKESEDVMMTNESHLSVHEKHIFVSKMNLGTLANFPRLEELAVAANYRGLFNGMLVYFDRENGKDLDFANGLHNLWAELLERTNERQLFITELEGLCPSVMTYKILKFLNEVQNHDVIQLLEHRKMIVGTHRQVLRKISLIETIMSL
ncbi:hypothetical protein Tco_0156625 [Tanacetum coccineum]